MIELIEDNSIKNKRKILNKYDSIFKLCINENIIGIGALGNRDNENMIFLTIKKEYRGNGYGKKLFELLLKEAQNRNYKKICITIPKYNIQLLRILNTTNFVIISENDICVKYACKL